MSTASSNRLSSLAQFVSRRIDELRPRRSQLEIATAAGFQSPNMLSMIKTGKAKLAMEKVVPLAKALECDPAKLARLALEQFYEPDVLETILTASPDPKMRNVVNVTALTLGMEVRLGLRDLRFARQFANNAISRVERAHVRLTRVRAALDELADETRSARP